MVILGVGDGLDAGAALIVNDEPIAVETQSRHDQIPHSRHFPWKAIEAVLVQAGLRPRDVDLIAVGGRFTPPFVLRRHPELRRVARDAFSPVHDAKVFFQAVLRQTGWGAMEADRAAEWLDGRFKDRGFGQQKVRLVDIHRALAAAAYRSQPDDRALVVTLHPMGDGVASAVHRGGGGQLDRLFEQKGFASLHVHLQRCAAAMDLEPIFDDHRMWALAGRGEPDPELVALLQSELHVDGPRLSRRSYPFPGSRWESVYQALRVADRETAAASVYENLRQSVSALVLHHVRHYEQGVIALGGAIFDNPRLVADVAALDDVERVWVNPEPGWASLPLGAAMNIAGLHPRLLRVPGLGQAFDDEACQGALRAAGVTAAVVDAPAAHVATALEAGKSVARFAGMGGFGRQGSGSRSVLVRADDAPALERARRALGRDPDEEPVLAALDHLVDAGVDDPAAIAGPLRYGVVAPVVRTAFAERFPGAISPDGRAHLRRVDADSDPALHAILVALQARIGVGAVAVLPLAEGTDPVVALPGDAVRIYQRTSLDSLLLGSRWVSPG